MGVTSEADLAKVVIAYLEDLQWDVYQEVQIYQGSPIADIVAVQNGLVWVVECKCTFGLSVLAQAENWLAYAHKVSVATPPIQRRNYSIARRVLQSLNVNVLEVAGSSVSEIRTGKFNRNAQAKRILDTLSERHKTYAAAGTNTGRRWTPFQETCEAVKTAVVRVPGIRIAELLAGVKTHYASTSSAQSCIAHWAKAGKIPGVRVEREGRAIRLYPAVSDEAVR